METRVAVVDLFTLRIRKGMGTKFTLSDSWTLLLMWLAGNHSNREVIGMPPAPMLLAESAIVCQSADEIRPAEQAPRLGRTPMDRGPVIT